MVTAKDAYSDVVRALESGADDYIVKPLSKKDVLSKVNNMLAKAKTGELPSQAYLNKMKDEKKGE
jgi:DNA-binding response OmpR family regulator